MAHIKFWKRVAAEVVLGGNAWLIDARAIYIACVAIAGITKVLSVSLFYILNTAVLI